MDKINKIYELVEELNVYRQKYYQENESLVSDHEYDKLFDELKALEVDTGIVLSNSPTTEVGYETVNKFQKVVHKIPLLSLDKTKSVNELLKFMGDKKTLLMLKNDGLTVKIEYENGKLVRGSTRGNGNEGEDITHNVKTFKNIPSSIPFQGKLTIVGEAIIHKGDFDKINAELPEDKKYKTPRNLVSGSVRQQDSEICSKREVYFHAFGILECDIEISNSQIERLKWLSKLGLWTVIYAHPVDSQKTLEHNIVELKQLADDFGIPIDGLVLMFDDIEYGLSLGSTSHHALHSIAYKFGDEVAETELLDVQWFVGRTGNITPVAYFNPVILDGTSVSRASLHNVGIFKKLQLGYGDKITVQKANQIIPQVLDNLTRSNDFDVPTYCPSCGEKVYIEQIDIAETLRCYNELCSAKIISRLTHFVSRDAMNIEGLSEATIIKLVELGIINGFHDIFDLEKYEDDILKGDILKLEGFGEKSLHNLIKSIRKSKNVKLENFLYALGIPNVGRSACKVISKWFGGSWEEFINAIDNGFDFTQFQDFGKVMHDSITRYFNDTTLFFDADLCADELNFILPEKTDASLKDLTGLTFVITGSVNTFANRSEFKDLVESLGGKVSGSVSKNTDYLVCNEESSSSKSKKAQDLGVVVISENVFNKMINRVV